MSSHACQSRNQFWFLECFLIFCTNFIYCSLHFFKNKLIHFSLIVYDDVPESSNVIITQHSESVIPYRKDRSSSSITFAGMEDKHDIKIPSTENTVTGNVKHRILIPSPSHPLIQPSTVVRDHCENFAFPPPPPPTDRKRYGPRRKSLLFSFFFILSVIYPDIQFGLTSLHELEKLSQTF